jgi:hypothetical protein
MIERFKSEIGKYGVQSANRYVFSCGASDFLHFYAINAAIPGRSISTSEIKYGSSFTIKKPYNQIFEDLTVTFMMDEAGYIKTFFDNWMNQVVSPVDNRIGYYNDYVRTGAVDIYKKNGELSYSVELIDMYPINITNVDLSYNSMDTIASFTVTFAYKTIQISAGGISTASAGMMASAGSNLALNFDNPLGATFNGAFQAINSILPAGISVNGSGIGGTMQLPGGLGSISGSLSTGGNLQFGARGKSGDMSFGISNSGISLGGAGFSGSFAFA